MDFFLDKPIGGECLTLKKLILSVSLKQVQQIHTPQLIFKWTLSEIVIQAG